MEELLNAAKELLAHRESYYKKHPELLEVYESVEDKEYDAAWDRLDMAVKKIEPDVTRN